MVKQFKTIDSYNCEWTIFHDLNNNTFTGYPTNLLDRHLTLPISIPLKYDYEINQFINMEKDFFLYQLSELLDE